MQGDGRLPEELRGLPLDARSAGAGAKAGFEYQADVASLTVLEHLLRGDLKGIALELVTDFVVVTTSGLSFVSVKHRMPSQGAESAWSWSELRRRRVLVELHAAWRLADREC